MKLVKVKVFNAYTNNEKYYEELGIESFMLFEYHNQILTKYGLVCPKDSWNNMLKPIKPLPEDVKEITKFELDNVETTTYNSLKASVNNAKELFENYSDSLEKYEAAILNKCCKDKELYGGEFWECNLSPIGRCVYEFDGNEYTCIFCGEPEERK